MQEELEEGFEKSVIFSSEQQSQMQPSGLSVHDELIITDRKSIFIVADQKLEVESIYDNLSKTANKTRFGKLPTKLQKANMPVTFHKKIKSSGYSAAPGSLKYTAKQKQKVAQSKSMIQWTISQDFFAKPLPMMMSDEVQILNKQAASKSAITKLQYSPLGTKLAYSSQDTMISVMKTPLYQNSLEITSLQGHNGNINSLNWSRNDQYLISASADKSCIIWNLNWSKKGEKLLVLDNQIKTKLGQNESKSSKQNPFTEQIRQAQFYHNDKLIVLCSGNKLNFYQYELPIQEHTADDVKRLQQRGLYKLI